MRPSSLPQRQLERMSPAEATVATCTDSHSRVTRASATHLDVQPVSTQRAFDVTDFDLADSNTADASVELTGQQDIHPPKCVGLDIERLKPRLDRWYLVDHALLARCRDHGDVAIRWHLGDITGVVVQLDGQQQPAIRQMEPARRDPGECRGLERKPVTSSGPLGLTLMAGGPLGLDPVASGLIGPGTGRSVSRTQLVNRRGWTRRGLTASIWPGFGTTRRGQTQSGHRGDDRGDDRGDNR